MNDKIKEVEALIDKAANAECSTDALRFSQAASNAVNAICGMTSILSDQK